MATIEFLFSIICGTSVPNNELFRKFPFLMSFKTESSTEIVGISNKILQSNGSGVIDLFNCSMFLITFALFLFKVPISILLIEDTTAFVPIDLAKSTINDLM